MNAAQSGGHTGGGGSMGKKGSQMEVIILNFIYHPLNVGTESVRPVATQEVLSLPSIWFLFETYYSLSFALILFRAFLRI